MIYKLKCLLSGGLVFQWVGDSYFGTLFNYRLELLPSNEVIDKNLHKNELDKGY